MHNVPSAPSTCCFSTSKQPSAPQRYDPNHIAPLTACISSQCSQHPFAMNAAFLPQKLSFRRARFPLIPGTRKARRPKCQIERSHYFRTRILRKILRHRSVDFPFSIIHDFESSFHYGRMDRTTKSFTLSFPLTRFRCWIFQTDTLMHSVPVNYSRWKTSIKI